MRQSWMLVRFEWPINLCHESTIHAFVIEHNIVLVGNRSIACTDVTNP